MKTNRIIALAIAAATMFSCAENKEEGPVVPEEPQPQTMTLTFTLPSYGQGEGQALKESWQPGDRIVVHGEYAKSQVTVTLAASDISSDGKSASKTVEGLFPYKRDDCSSTLYAAYPAEAVDNLPHCFFYSKFSNTNIQVLAACNNGSNFQFEDVCGAVSFTIDESFDSYIISGLKKETLGYEFLQVKMTDAESNFRQYLGAGLPSFSGDMTEGRNMIFFPSEVAAEGCILKLKRGDEIVKTARIETPFAIERGKAVDLGNITALLKVYDNPFSPGIKDIDENGNANCYIVTEPGTYKFKAVRGNMPTDFLTDVAEACVLWETWNNDEEVTAGSVVESASYAEDYMIFHTPSTLRSGNAVIAAKDFDGKILWSWHIWVPATKIEENTYGIFNTALMDRNLGALVAAVAGDEPVDVRSYGLFYQWGRKDPFVGAKRADSGSNATVAGVELSLASSQISIEESIANPTVLGHMDNADWSTTHEQDLWQDDVKTIYDPCPAGYKVPGRDKSQVLFGGKYDSSVSGWGISSSAYWITIGSPKAVFPVAGYRDDCSLKGIAYPGGRTAIWTAHCSSDGVAYHLNWRISGNKFSLGETARARGCSVRCVAE